MTEETKDVTSTELAAAGKTGPRVTREQIQALMAKVEYRVDVPEGTTTTFVHAFLNGKFLLATGFSACVDPANFVAAIGVRIATEDAMHKAQDKLWELESYKLYAQLNAPVQAPVIPADGEIRDIDAMAFALEQWHINAAAQANQLMGIPVGFAIEYDPGNGQPPISMPLQGAAHIAFLAGVTSGAGVFSKLPFAASVEVAPADEAD